MAHRLTRTVAVVSLLGLLALSALVAVVQPSWAFGLSSAVRASAGPVYEFSIPPDQALVPGRSQYHLGVLRVGSLFLRHGEQLQIVILRTSFTKSGVGAGAVPFRVIFSNPGLLDSSNVGDSFDVAIRLDARELAAAASGTYTGSVTFKIVSYPEGLAVWEDSVSLTLAQRSTGVPSRLVPAVARVPATADVDILAGSLPAVPGDVDGQTDPPDAPDQDAGVDPRLADDPDEVDGEEAAGVWARWLADYPWIQCCIPLFLLLPLLFVLRSLKKSRQEGSDPSGSD